MPYKYGPVFALYLYRIESNRVNTVQKRVRIYIAFFLCSLFVGICMGSLYMYIFAIKILFKAAEVKPHVHCPLKYFGLNFVQYRWLLNGFDMYLIALVSYIIL